MKYLVVESLVEICVKTYEFVKFVIDELTKGAETCWRDGKKIAKFIRRFMEENESLICNEDFLNGKFICCWNDYYTKLRFFCSAQKR